MAGAVAPDDSFNLTEGLDDGLAFGSPVEDFGLELSFYQQFDDAAVAVAPDTLTGSLDFDEAAEQDAPELSFYQQLDDDAVGVAESLIGSFDFIESEAQIDDVASFYYQQDDDVIVVTPPPVVTTGGGGVAGRVYVLPGREHSRVMGAEVDESARKPAPVLEVRAARVNRGSDLTALRDRLLDLGRSIERNKQAVKDRIRAEQARADSPELPAILQQLIVEYELTLYNQNAARLLMILADDI